jgi:hypothetical protein
MELVRDGLADSPIGTRYHHDPAVRFEHIASPLSLLDPKIKR